jgi:hypothetical protein
MPPSLVDRAWGPLVLALHHVHNAHIHRLSVKRHVPTPPKSTFHAINIRTEKGLRSYTHLGFVVRLLLEGIHTQSITIISHYCI